MNTQSILVRCAIAIAFVVPAVIPLACSSSSPSSGGGEDSGTVKEGDSGTGTTDTGTGSTIDTGSSSVVDTGTGTGTDTGTAPPSDAPAAGAWPGVYTCTLTGQANLNIGPQTLPLDATMTVTESGTAISGDLMGDGGVSCTVTFTDQGNGTADINPGQSCMFAVTMPITTTATISFVATAGNDAGPPGTATLSGNTITANLPFDISAAGGIATGTGVLTGPCTK